jgi:hypothetical protein
MSSEGVEELEQQDAFVCPCFSQTGGAKSYHAFIFQNFSSGPSLLFKCRVS